MMVQTILVGLDWGETVDAVAGMAVDLAMALDASVKALYVEDTELILATERAAIATLPTSGAIPLDTPNFSELEAEFQSEERVLAKRFLRLVSDTRIRGSFLIERGEVPKILVRESRAHDLLVLGKYSEQDPEDGGGRPLGRHIEEILRRAWCPVALVPPGAALGSRYLAVYDGSPTAHRCLGAAVRLARATEAELEVLVVAKGAAANELKDEVEAYLASHRLRAASQSVDGDPVGAIFDEVDRFRADLLCMGAFGTSRRKEALDPEVAIEVLKGLDLPALLCGTMEEE